MAIRAESDIEVVARRCLEHATAHLLALQSDEGWWRGENQSNATMDAEDLLLREFLGIRRDDQTARTAQRIRSQQREDGTWAVYFGGPGDLSTTIECYAALRLAGDVPEAGHMVPAAKFVREAGGIEGSRSFTRIWLALFGLVSWDHLPALPPEVILLPRWFPLNIYDFASWARLTIVPLTVLWSFRPRVTLPFSLDELSSGVLRAPKARPLSWKAFFLRLDRALHAYERRRIDRLRRRALKRAEEWIVRRQEADGLWGGIQPSSVYSIIALRLIGYPLDHPVIRAGINGLETLTTVENDARRIETCLSPVWDTAHAIIALADAGLPADNPALVRAAEWLLARQVCVRGDWAVRRPSIEPGGWAFQFHNDNCPDLDDTAEVVMALRRVNIADGARIETAITRAVAWSLGMQSRDGGWGAFDADNERWICGEHPFCDFGQVIDPPSEDVTAHVVEMLAHEGLRDSTATRRAVQRLSSWQLADGSWFGRWGVNHVYGTGAAVPALVAAGVSPSDTRITRAVSFLEAHQNADGGWGEDPRSYDDMSWVGRGTSTASQTAWALLALLAAGGRGSEVVERAIRFLVSTQRSDGTWDEPQFTGTGFPKDFFSNYHLYRAVFPVYALGRYVNETRA